MDQVQIRVTGGALRNNYLTLRGFLDSFPADAIGGNTESQAGKELTLELEGLTDPVETDINGPKQRFRRRGAFREFFAANEVKQGDIIEIDELGPRRYAVRVGERRGGLNVDDPLSREAVLKALEEFDSLGREDFLDKYGFQQAKAWLLRHEGREYDSKAIYGVAFGFQHPEIGPLASDDFRAGVPVVRRLRALGFDVQQDSDVDPTGVVWLNRGGDEGEYEQLAIDQGVAVIGWSGLGELSAGMSRDDIKALITDQYGEQSVYSVRAQGGQVWRFINEVSEGDLVVMPIHTDSLAKPEHVAIGRYIGPYRYRGDEEPFTGTDAVHTRDVAWLSDAVPYSAFDDDLQSAFGQQGTLSRLDEPDAATRLLAAMEDSSGDGVHLLIRWSAENDPETISEHRSIASAKGAVWWGKLGEPGKGGMSEARLNEFRDQLEEGIRTYVFLYRSGETWRAQLRTIQPERPEKELDLVPASYRDLVDSHHLWMKLEEFEQLDPDFPRQSLAMDGSDDPQSVAKALKGMSNLMYVRQRTGSAKSKNADSSPVVWWVNQGASYKRSREGGYLWAPKHDKAGHSRPYWDALTLARTGDLVVSYANGKVRAMSEVVEEAFDASRPADEDASAWGNDGRRLNVKFRDLDPPIELSEIPLEWRIAEPGPFTQEGNVKQAYFFRLSDEFVARMEGRFPELGLNVQAQEVTALSAEAISNTATAKPYKLRLPDTLYATVAAALESGKHVILTGPPGTAKTTLAQAVADTAKALGHSHGYLLTTATADWTTYETIGGLRPTGPNELEFRLGHFLEAISERQWLVIDELNRSQFDRAFGQLFTVLSGQPVTLPYARPGADSRLTLLPAGKESPDPTADVLRIPARWRIVATMNVFDKTLLFDMSYALMRRFAFIEVPSPDNDVFEELIEDWADGSEAAADTAKALMSVREIKDIGPAVYRDIARFSRLRLADETIDIPELRFQAFYSYLLPQFEGITDEEGERLLSRLTLLIGQSQAWRSRIRSTLNQVLGLELEDPGAELAEEGPPPEADTEGDNET